MLSTDRKFHFIGKLNITRSKFLDSDSNPEDDEVNWLFLILNDDARYSFVYKIEKNQDVKYESPFIILIAFTFYDLVENAIQLNQQYTVQRGEEEIGRLEILKKNNN